FGPRSRQVPSDLVWPSPPVTDRALRRPTREGSEARVGIGTSFAMLGTALYEARRAGLGPARTPIATPTPTSKENNVSKQKTFDRILDTVGLQRRAAHSNSLLPALGLVGVGAMVGATLGVLWAPRSGKELRAS